MIPDKISIFKFAKFDKSCILLKENFHHFREMSVEEISKNGLVLKGNIEFHIQGLKLQSSKVNSIFQ